MDETVPGTEQPREKSIRKNALVNGFRIGMSFIFPLITFPYISRILGPEGVGRFNFANSVVNYFLMLAAMGIPIYGTREAAKVRNDPEKLAKVGLELVALNWITAGLTYMVFFICVFLVPQFRSDASLFLVMGCAILLNAFGMSWMFQATENYTYITVRTFAFQCFSVILMFLFVHTKNDVVIYAIIFLISSVGSNILNFLRARKYLRRKNKERLGLRRHVKGVMTLFGMNVGASFYGNINTVLLGFVSGPVAVGYFASAYRVTNLIQAVVLSASDVLLPRSSHYVGTGRMDEFEKLIRKALRFLIFLSLPCIVGLSLMNQEIIGAFAGSRFLPAGPVLVIICWKMLVSGLGNLFGMQILLPLGKERITLRAVAIGAVVVLVADVFLLPSFAHVGAAVSALIAEFVVMAIQIPACRRYLKYLRFDWKSYLPYLAGTVLIVGVITAGKILLTGSLLRLAVCIPVSIAVYGVVMILVKDEFAYAILHVLKMLRRRTGKMSGEAK